MMMRRRRRRRLRRMRRMNFLTSPRCTGVRVSQRSLGRMRLRRRRRSLGRGRRLWFGKNSDEIVSHAIWKVALVTSRPKNKKKGFLVWGRVVSNFFICFFSVGKRPILLACNLETRQCDFINWSFL